jgi:hypothetical protein
MGQPVNKDNVEENKFVEHVLKQMDGIAKGTSIPTPLAKYLARSTHGNDILFIGQPAHEIITALLDAGKCVTAILDTGVGKHTANSSDRLIIKNRAEITDFGDYSPDHVVINPAPANEGDDIPSDPLKAIDINVLSEIVKQVDAGDVTVKFPGEVDMQSLEDAMGNAIQVREFLFGIGVLFFTATADIQQWIDLIGEGG